jgi:hypothetical protein
VTFRVRLFEGNDDFAMRRVRLYVDESFPGFQRVMLNDGTWHERSGAETTTVLPAGVAERAHLFLPVQALEPLGEELERFLRGATHAATEAAVLREWLDVERGRVDDMLARPERVE